MLNRQLAKVVDPSSVEPNTSSCVLLWSWWCESLLHVLLSVRAQHAYWCRWVFLLGAEAGCAGGIRSANQISSACLNSDNPHALNFFLKLNIFMCLLVMHTGQTHIFSLRVCLHILLLCKRCYFFFFFNLQVFHLSAAFVSPLSL